MNKVVKDMLNAFWYWLVFMLLQFFATCVVGTIWYMTQGKEAKAAFQSVFDGTLTADGMEMVVTTVVASLLTIGVFALFRWSPFSRSYLRTHPWLALVWVVVLACGTIIPSEWLLEQLNVQMPEGTEKMFEEIMGRPEGYIVIGILAPIAEEMVFRGAILRSLLKAFSKQMHWLAIIISALLFGATHGNLPQGCHAFAIGLLLGWLYYRTNSIVPGIVFHWVNNSVAYVMFNLLPQENDGKLIDLFHGNQRMMMYAIGFSLCILLPALFQLAMRLRRPKE